MPIHQIYFYVPESHLGTVKQAMFDTGAGKIGNYSYCAWQCKGRGQFKPEAGSKPYLGQHGIIEEVDEWKVEMICEEKFLAKAIGALKMAHPYDMPAYGVIKLEAISNLS